MSDTCTKPHTLSILEQSLRDTINKNTIDVPMLPEVAGRVVQITNDPESDASAMAKLVQADQILAAQVMRIANSAIYSPNGGNMVSLQQAIARLGIQLIGDIALSASINSKLFNAPGYETYVQSIIKQSLASALWAKEIARATRKNVEAAFLGGLLHDIGRPVTIQSIIEISSSLDVKVEEKDVFTLEKQYQRKVGSCVVRQWKMPTAVCETIEYFDRYNDEHSNQTQTLIVVAASHFAKILNADDSRTDEEKFADLQTLDTLSELNFYQDDIESLLLKSEQVNSTLQVMSL